MVVESVTPDSSPVSVANALAAVQQVSEQLMLPAENVKPCFASAFVDQPLDKKEKKFEVFELAVELRRMGVNREAVEDLLAKRNDSLPSPLGPSDVRSAVKSAWRDNASGLPRYQIGCNNGNRVLPGHHCIGKENCPFYCRYYTHTATTEGSPRRQGKDCDAFVARGWLRQLSPQAAVLYLACVDHERRRGAALSGKVVASYRQLAEWSGLDKSVIAARLRELEASGLLTVRTGEPGMPGRISRTATEIVRVLPIPEPSISSARRSA